MSAITKGFVDKVISGPVKRKTLGNNYLVYKAEN